MSINAQQSRAGNESGGPPATPSSSSSSVHVAEVLLIQDISDADGTTTTRFYANPSARSLPGPKLPEYHPKSLESALSGSQKKEEEDHSGGNAGEIPSSGKTREEGSNNVEGGEVSSATTHPTHRNLLGPAAVHPSAISLSKPEIAGLLARILIVVGDDMLVHALEPWMVKEEREEEEEEGREPGKVGFPEQDFKRFIGAHMNADNDGLHQEEEEQQHAAKEKADFVCIISWWRRLVQSLSSFVVAQKIADGRPWSTDSASPPWTGKFDRYSPWPARPRRPNHLLSTSREGGVAIHAAQECMSLYWGVVGGIQTGVGLVDMVPQHRIHRARITELSFEVELREDPRFIPCFLATAVDDGQQQQLDKEVDKETISKVMMRNPYPCFKTRREREEEPTPMARLSQFVKALAEVESMPHSSEDFVQSVIAHMVCQDLSDLLRSIGLVLDSIELSLHDDNVLQQAMPAWRAFLGAWRNICYHQSALLERMALRLVPKADPETKPSAATADLARNLSRVKNKLDRLSKRVDSTFQSLMSSVTIVESSRAIRQAELVTKLTQLAFFFIPISLVAAAFGMNINEFEGQLVWWHWIVASTAVSMVTYLILYWREIYNSIKSLSKKFTFGLTFLVVVTGLSVATWRLSLSSLPGPAQVIISIFVIWLPAVFLYGIIQGGEESVGESILALLLSFAIGGLCTAEWRLADSVSIASRVKVAVGPLIFLVPFHLLAIAEHLWRRVTKGSQDPTVAQNPTQLLRGCLHLITAGTTTGSTVAIWELGARALPLGVRVGITSVLSWLLAACMCALHVIFLETRTGPQPSRMRLLQAAAAGILAVVVLAVMAWKLDDSGAQTAVKGAVAPLLFWLPVALMNIWWTQHRSKGRAVFNVILVLGLLLGISIGAWKIGDSGLDADVKTAARMWAIWYAPSVVYGIFRPFSSPTGGRRAGGTARETA